MERKVIHRDYQEMTAADLNNPQIFVQESLDRLVSDAIGPGMFFTGFDESETGTWEVTLSAGRFIQDGRMYRRSTNSVLNLYNLRPLVNKNIIAITAWGQTLEVDVQPRDFLTNVDTGATQPDSVSMESLRSAEVSMTAGAEAPQPSEPTIAPNSVVIALVTLNASGIESIVRVSNNILPQVLRNLVALGEIAVWRSGVGTAIDTIRSDLASLALTFNNYVERGEFNLLRDEVAVLKAQVQEALALAQNQPTPPDIYQFVDTFFDDLQSDDGASGYAALIEDGVLTFPLAASDTPAGGLALVNPSDPRVAVSGNMMRPVATGVLRYDTTAGVDEGTADMLAYTTSTQTYKSVARPISRWIAGATEYNILIESSLHGEPWVDGAFGNWVPKTRMLGTKLFEYVSIEFLYQSTTNPLYDIWGAKYVHKGEGHFAPYNLITREQVVSTTNYTAQARAQVFMNANPGTLYKAQLEIVSRAGSGDIRAVVMACDGDQPNLNRVMAEVTVAYVDLVDGMNDFVFQPVDCAAGQRYAIAFFSAGNHKLRLRSNTRNITKGNSLALEIADTWIIPTEIADQDLSIKLHFNGYTSSRVEVDLQSLELAGGIDNIRIDTPIDTPPGTEIRLEGYVDGVWYGLIETAGTQPSYDWSAALRSVIQIRAVFIGTGDLFPSLGIGALSTVRVSRRDTTLKHVSEARDVGSGNTVTQAQTRMVVENWDAANTAVPSLIVSAAPVAADSVVDQMVDGRLIRTGHFTFAANRYFTPVIDATTGTGKNMMLFTERHDVAS